MNIRRVQLTSTGDFSVAVWHQEQWVPLKPALAMYHSHTGNTLPDLEAASGDVIAFLQGGEVSDKQVKQLLKFVQSQNIDLGDTFDPAPILPFKPLSFRGFMLYEKHAIAAARGAVKRFMPQMWESLSKYEFSTGQPHPELLPKKLWYEKPIYYMGNHLSFLSEGATIPWPNYTKALDYELELGVVIVRPIRNATPEEALSAIGGFTVLNDFSARDIQYPEMTSGFGPVKAKNFATGMGAVVVMASSVLPYVENLNVKVKVNGRVWGHSNTAGAQYSLGEMVAYASLGEQLLPGEVLGSGTIVGCSGMETEQWLAPGDEIVLEIERVGTLRNVIGIPEAITPSPSRDPQR